MSRERRGILHRARDAIATLYVGVGLVLIAALALLVFWPIVVESAVERRRARRALGG